MGMYSAKMIRRLKLGAAAVIFTVLFVSCPNEVGLGAAVDTQRPTVSFQTPEADSVVRNTVTFTGKANDEKELKTVTVTFKPLDSSGSESLTKTYPAQVNTANGTWSLTIDTQDPVNGLPDSRYIATVTAKDTSGKTSEEPRTFQIDNTQPTVLITSPTLYGTNSTKFCEQVEIRGETYDASDVKSVTVFICDAEGNVITQAAADGTNTWTALFRSSAIMPLLNETDSYYFYAVAEDAAGNRNATYYHKADIFSLPNVDAGFPSMNEIGRLDQGIYTTTPTGVQASDLLPQRISTGATAIKAAVQAATPEDPTVYYPGFTYQKTASAQVRWTNLGEKSDLIPTSIGKGTSVFVTIMPPTDNSAVLLDTITVEMWVKKENPGETPTPEEIWTPGGTLVSPGVTSIPVGDSVNCTISTNDKDGNALQPGRYTVKLSFKTNSSATKPDDQAIISDDRNFQITSEAPVILEEVITGENGQKNTLSNMSQHASGVFNTPVRDDGDPSSPYTLKGTLQQYTETGLVEAGVSAWMHEDDAQTKPFASCKNSNGEAVPVIGTYNSGSSIWTVRFKNAENLPDDTYTFTITAKNPSSSSITREYVLDTTPAELTILNVSDNDVISTGSLTVNGTAIDNLSGVKEIRAFIVKGGSETELSVTGSTKWSVVVPPSELTAEGTLTLKFLVEDKCGNMSTPLMYTLRLDRAAPQATMSAYIFDTDVAHSDVLYAGTNTSSALVLKGTADDASFTAGRQAASAVLAYTKDGGARTVASGFSWDQAAGTWYWILPVTGEGKLSDGLYQFTLTVTDDAERTAEATRTIRVDTTAPVISAASLLNGGKVWLDESGSNALSVTAEDSGTGASGLAGVWYTVTAENAAVPAFTDATESSWTPLSQGVSSWSSVIDFSTPASDEKLNVYVAAKDAAGNRAVYSENGSAKAVTVIKDKMVPELSIQSCADFTDGSDITMTLRVRDTNPTAPVVKIVDASATEHVLSVTGPADAAGYKEYTAVVPFTAQDAWFKQAGQYKSGQYTVTVTEADANGRAATPVTQKITLDATAPVLSLTSYGTASFQNSGNLIVRGTVTETNLEAIKAQLWKDGAQVGSDEDITDYTKNGDTYTFTWRTYDLEDGVYIVKVVAADKGGLTDSAETASVTVDKTAPAVTMGKTAGSTFLDRTDSSTVASPAEGGSYMTASSFTLGGTITEQNSESAVLSISKNGMTLSPVSFGSAAATWTYTQAAAQDHSDDGTYVYKFTVTDKAQNRTEKTITVLVDTTAPTVSISHPVLNESSSTTDYTIDGTIIDSNAGVKALYYTLDGTDPTAASPQATVSGSGWSKAISLGDTQGSLTLKIMAEDVLGNTIAKSVVFYYDTDNPVLTETGVGTNGTTTSSSFTFSGTASDTNALFGKQADGTATGAVTITTGSGASASTRTVNVASDGSWSAVFNAGTGTDAAGNPRISDGNHVFTITANDVAGKAVSVTRTVRVDTTAPVITETTFPASYIYLDDGVYARLTTKAADSAGTDPTGLAGVYYMLTTSATAPAFSAENEGSWTAMAQGASGWTANIDFTGNTDGTVYVYVAAKDLAGNRTVPTTAAACRATMTVDVIKPVLSVQSGATFTGSGSETLTVRVTDTNPTAPTVSVTGAATSNATVSAGPTATAADGSWKEWEVTVPMTADGTYTVTINEADGNSRAAVPVTHSIERDTQNPTVTITSYGEYSSEEGAANPPSYQNSATVTITGTAVDVNMKSVVVELFKKNEAVAYATENITNQLGADGSFTWKKWDCDEAEYTARVTATDKADQTTTKQTVAIIVDTVDPVTDVKKGPAQGQPGDASVIDTTQTLTVNEGFTLTGQVTEANLDSILMTVTKDGVQTYSGALTGPSWTYPQNVDSATHADDGTYVYTLTITDKAGNQISRKVTALIDTTGPELVVTLPAVGETSSATTYTLSGTVTDAGTGIAAADAVTYVVKKGAVQIASGSATVTGISWKAENVPLEKVVDAGTGTTTGEGEITVTVTAKDKLNQTATVTRSIFFDKSAPSLDETGTGDSGKTTNAAFTLSGTASDTNALYSADGTDGKGAITITAGNGASAISRTVDVDVANGGAWSAAFTPGSGDGKLADGTYTFTITAKDVAGRTTELRRTVIVDTQAPVIAKTGSNTSFVTTVAVSGWYKDAGLSLSATVSDNCAVETVESAVAQTAPADWKAVTDDAWHSLKKSGSVYTGTAEIVDGTNYICIRARDTAGNVTYTAAETVKGDMSSPVVAGVFKEQACTNEITSLLTNAGAALTVYMKADDLDPLDTDGTLLGSGTASMQVKIGNRSFTSGAINAVKVSADGVQPAVFSLTLSASDLASARGGADRSVVVYGRATDTAGNTSTPANLFTLQFDTTPPSVEFTAPSAGSTVNKTVRVTGKTVEAQTLKSVMLYANNVLIKTFTGDAMYSWSYDLDTTAYEPVSPATTRSITLKIAAEDEAGNTAEQQITITADQATDRPEIMLNNVAVSGMTASDAAKLSNQSVIYGSIVDDDGISSLKYASLSITKNGDGTLTVPTPVDSDWIQLGLQNGSFSINLSDNTYAIYFKAADSAGTTFTTGNSDTLLQPVLKGSDSAQAAGAVLYIRVDTQNPEAEVTEYSLDGTNWKTDLLRTQMFADNAQNSFQIRQYAYDANGISKVEVSVDDGAYAETAHTTALDKVEAGKKYEAFTYTYTLPAGTPLASDSHTLHIRITDNAGSTTERTATFSVDNDAPVIEFSSHKDEAQVYGKISINGTTKDAPRNTGATSLLYKITDSDTPVADWTETAAGIYGAHAVQTPLETWRIFFDGDIHETDFTHDLELSKILVSLPEYKDYLKIAESGTNAGAVVYKEEHDGHAAGTLYTDITRLYIHMKATDSCSNSSESCLVLKLDPQGGTPSVAITYPEPAAYGWSDGTGIIYTKTKLPAVGEAVYNSADCTTQAGSITAFNRIQETVTTAAGTFTCFGAETVQGGIIRLQGTVEDDKAGTTVFLQIVPNYDRTTAFAWNPDAIVPDGKDDSTKKLSEFTAYKEVSIGSTGLKGISVSTSMAWGFSLNKQGEFNGTQTKENYIAVRAIVLDSEGHINPLYKSDIMVMKIDSDTPRIGSSEELYLYQYSDNAAGTGNVVASQKYEDDMWIKGVWWLQGSVEDSNGIDELTVTGNNVSFIKNAASWTGTSGYRIKFKIGSDTPGSFAAASYEIYASDTDNKTVKKTISVHYDNKAPELAVPGSADYNISHAVVQSNGFYTLGSAVYEKSEGSANQSGFDRLALYFVRPDEAGTRVLYDTFLLKGNASNKVDLTAADISYSEGIYWKEKTVTRDQEMLSTLTLSAADANIHAGGLVKIGGAMYIIKSVDGTVVTVDGAPEASFTTAYFAMAHVVDHFVAESNGTQKDENGYYKDVLNSDYDQMVESVIKQTTTCIWEASINSRNIPDGAIEIHYVAFDKAGNYAVGIVACDSKENYAGPAESNLKDSDYDYDANNLARVANNAPRIAGVRYGTDENGNGTVSADELTDDLFAIDSANGGKYVKNSLVTSYVLGSRTVAADGKVTCGDTALKIKGGIAVIPEIVGGNGNLYWTFSVTKDGEASPYYTKTLTQFMDGGTPVTGTDYLDVNYGDPSLITDKAEIRMSLKDLLRKNAGGVSIDDTNDTKKLFKFVIWDSTSGLTAGTNSQKAEIELVATINLSDKVSPVPYIRPFYWTSATDNSVYRNAQNGREGHIDLAADLPDSTYFTGDSAKTDTDDKVSGKIVIEGTANDNIQLESLYLKVFTESAGTLTDAFTFKTGAATTATTAAFKRTAESASADFTCYKVAEYSDGAWTAPDYLTDYGWKFSVIRDEFSQATGHTATWQLVLDTEKLDVAVVNDLKVAVMAKDYGSPTLTGTGDAEAITWVGNASTFAPDTVKTSGTTVETQTNLNSFDVVPYITGITTTLSGAYTNCVTAFSRSALGLYPVRRGETITLNGYNLAATGMTTSVNLGSETLTPVSSGVNSIQVAVGNTSTTGSLSVQVKNGGTLVAESLNNEHDDKKAYNVEPNGLNNNSLTDVRKLYVWGISDVVTGTQLRYPSFAVSKSDAQNVAFVYGSGSQDVFMYNGGSSFQIDKSNSQWYDTAVAIDGSNRMYGVAMNGAGGTSSGAVLDWGSAVTNQANGGYANFGFYAWNTSQYPGQIYQGSKSLFGGTTDGWKNPDSSEYLTYSSGYKKVCLENAYDGSTAHTNRIINPKMVVSDDAKTYLVYYDQLSGQIRFRYGTVSGNMNANSQLTFTDGLGNHGNSNSGSAANYQIIAGSGAGSANTTRAGEYAAVGLVPAGATGAGTAVVAWTDGRNLWFSYNEAPTTVNNDTWATNTVLIDSVFAGWYVDMDVDAAGGIHIAYYTSSSGDLKYAYIPAYNQAADKEIVTVDSYNTVGTQLSITVSGEQLGGRYVPYISYYMSTFMRTSYSNRVAWPISLNEDGTFASGSDSSDVFTGKWEVMTIPTDEAPLEYTVGIGIKKNDAGVNNPILGYATTGHLQTAQLQGK